MISSIKILLTITLLAAYSMGQAQVVGKVTQHGNGLPIAGVTIQVDKGTMTRTDEQGRFILLRSDQDRRLRFQHIAYQDTLLSLPKGIETVQMTMRLKAQEILEVIVHTGYQQISRDRATGSFATVSKKQLEKQVGSGITAMLPALANGILLDNPSSPPGKLMVRGLSTIRADKQPLIVVDNFPYEGRLDDIHPADIEEVTILKDAAASAIWGVRAGNGVIVVTTKKGKFNQRQQFQFSSVFRVGQTPDLARLDLMTSEEFIGLEEFLFEKGFYNSRISSTGKPGLTPIVEALDKVRKNTLSQSDYSLLREELQKIDVRNEYRKHFYSKALFQQHHIQGNGGSEKHTWLTSVGYDRDISVSKALGERITTRLANTMQLHKKLLLSTDINGIYAKTGEGKPAYGSITQGAYQLYPYAQFADQQGNPLRINQRNTAYLDQVAAEGYLLDWNYYPLTDYKNVDSQKSRFILNLSTGLNYRLTDYLALDLKYNLVTDRDETTDLRTEESYFARNLINSFSVIDKVKGTVQYNIPKGAIQDRWTGQKIAHNVRLQANVHKAWEAHRISALLGVEGRSTRGTAESARLYGYNPANLSFAQVDYVMRFPDVVTSSLNNIPNIQAISKTNIRYISLYGNGVYSYDDRLHLSGSLRRDATNLFGLRTNDKWNLLWSVGANWKVLDKTDLPINRINLRTTYGFSGNVDPSMASVNTIRYMGVDAYNKTRIANIVNYANPDLKWESTGTLNLAGDMVALDQRLRISYDWYRKKGKDLYGSDEMDPTAGIGTSVIRNAGQMTGKGWDLLVDFDALRSQIWGLNVQVNLSRNEDRIDQYYLKNLYGKLFTNERVISGVKGKPVYSVFSYPWKGLDTDGNPIGLFNGADSKEYRDITNSTLLEDMVYSGPVLPKWFGAAGTTVRYRNLSMDVRILYKFGYFIRTKSVNYYGLVNQNRTHSDFNKRWQQPGDEKHTSVPVMLYPLNSNRDDFYTNAAVLVESGSHVRLHNVHLQYNLDRIWRASIGAQLFINADNLGLLWKQTDKPIDPEYENTTNGLQPPKQWSLGCRLKF